MFLNNGYPLHYFNKVLRKFTDSLSESGTSNKDPDSDSDSFKNIIKIPFVGEPSYDFANKLTCLFWNEFQVSVHPVFSSLKVRSYFNLKSQTPYLLCSRVVYQFTCLCDANMSYIGKTKRHLITRAREHLTLGGIKQSEVKAHLESCGVCRAAKPDTDFRILKSCRTDYQARVQEALLIKKLNPRLNKQLFNKGSFFTLKLF